METYLININQKVRETEKAYLFACPVYWASGTMKSRDFWFPKSAIIRLTQTGAEVKAWFINKLERENAFHGYTMNFDR